MSDPVGFPKRSSPIPIPRSDDYDSTDESSEEKVERVLVKLSKKSWKSLSAPGELGNRYWMKTQWGIFSREPLSSYQREGRESHVNDSDSDPESQEL